jgi:ParB/RepB/Spo0J family partition protein
MSKNEEQEVDAAELEEVELEETELEEVEDEEVTSEWKDIPLDQLVPHKEQCTDIRNMKKFERLVEDIKKYGLNQPILVRPIIGGKYEVVAGYNRWKAIEKIGNTQHIEAKIVEMSDDESAERCLTDNLHHQELTPYFLELCIFTRYDKGNYNSHGELGDKLGFSDTWIRQNIKAHEIRKQLLQKYSNFYIKISTESLNHAKKILDYGRDLQDLSEFLKIAENQDYGTSDIERIVEEMSHWIDEDWNNFLYNEHTFEKVKNAVKRRTKEENDDSEKPNKTPFNRMYKFFGKDLNKELDKFDEETKEESIRHIKLTIVLLSEILLKQRYIEGVHFRQISDDILNVTIDPHNYGGNGDLEKPGESYAQRLEDESNEVTSDDQQKPISDGGD